jgi:hypothetical protein
MVPAPYMTESVKSGPKAGGAPGGPSDGGADAPDEFAHIPSRTRHPIVGIAGALLAFFLVFHIRHDLRFALSPSTPQDLGAARDAFGHGAKAAGDYENRYVRVAGMPDRESALEIDTKGSWEFTQFFRILGTDERLFVHRPPSPLPAAQAEADVFQGRLIRFSELSFADSARRYFAGHVVATHFFAPPAFVAALAARPASGAVTLADRAGDTVALRPEEPLAVEVVKPDQVQLGLPRGPRFMTEPDARAAIESRGGEVLASRGLVKGTQAGGPEAGPLSAAPPPPERWTFVVRFAPARRQSALDEIGDLDRLVEIRDARETIATHVADVAAAGEGLVVRAAGAPERRLAPAEIGAVHTVAPVVVPGDAFLLVEGDRPRDHLATVVIALMLVMFGTVNVAGLVRGLRGRRQVG